MCSYACVFVQGDMIQWNEGKILNYLVASALFMVGHSIDITGYNRGEIKKVFSEV